jgi:UDP-N-acetylmuramoyl-L-alanyl-D-glutamate--2,6-diaminopimelate ligase
MQLRELIRNVDVMDPAEAPETEISGIAYDSRQVRNGYLFAAIRGARTDGNHFVDQAIRRGAGAVLSENPRPPAFPRPWVRVRHGRRALARTAANYFGHPTRNLSLVGVTGTNGKTSTAYLLESILSTGGSRVGLISTITYRTPGWSASAGLTTPESLDLQELLHRYQQNGCRQVVMEVSSHALDLNRVFASRFEVAVFTNLSPEHLDYHESMNSYYRAKKQLFVDTGYGPPQVSVVNVDDSWGQKLAGSIPGRCLTFSLSRPADFGVLECRSGWSGMQIRMRIHEEDLEVRTPLLGSFNLSNLIAAAAAASSLGVDRDALRDGIEACPPVPGRFEQIDCGQSFQVIVDYAHTPDALRNVLATARELGSRRVLVLFGCGGERDRAKRPAMGSIAERHSDWVMVTSDNARGEDPMAILGEIQAGFRFDRHEVEPDRREAIRRLFSRAESGDVVILAGKGHEIGQQEGGRVRPFDDRQVARAVLREMDYGDAASSR